MWHDPCDPRHSWRVFDRVDIFNGNQNPMQWLLSFGIGDGSPLTDRRDDSFGIGWFYTGISDEMSPVVSGLLNHGQGIELYCTFSVSECCRITPDLQIVEPNAVTADVAVVPGLRALVKF
ncbi:MAG: carbohydrate porin [Fuerstiella sp.]|nr:carbohydrate porin [Fuerstiella sp.]